MSIFESPLIKITEIKDSNIDDYIRQSKRLGKKRFYWNKKTAKILRNFARSVYWDLGVRLPHSFPHKCVFMGVKHYVI